MLPRNDLRNPTIPLRSLEVIAVPGFQLQHSPNHQGGSRVGSQACIAGTPKRSGASRAHPILTKANIFPQAPPATASARPGRPPLDAWLHLITKPTGQPTGPGCSPDRRSGCGTQPLAKKKEGPSLISVWPGRFTVTLRRTERYLRRAARPALPWRRPTRNPATGGIRRNRIWQLRVTVILLPCCVAPSAVVAAIAFTIDQPAEVEIRAVTPFGDSSELTIVRTRSHRVATRGHRVDDQANPLFGQDVVKVFSPGRVVEVPVAGGEAAA